MSASKGHMACFPSNIIDVQYVTCRAQMCTEANRNYPFPEYIEISSLVVQDDYIFIQVRTQKRQCSCLEPCHVQVTTS